MAEVNPRIVLVRISGYGQTGPYRERAGYGNVSESVGGLRYVTGFPDRPPVRVGVSLGDALAAQQAALGALLALRVAEQTGRGQVVDVAITEAVYALTEGMITEYAHQGVVRERTGNQLLRAAPSNVYRTGDGKWIAIGGNGENVFRRLARAIGQPELADDPRFKDNRARIAHADLLDDLIGAWTAAHSLQEAAALLDDAGVPAGPVMSIADIAADPQFQARGMIQHAGGALDADTRAVLSQVLGLDAAALDVLARRGVIGGRETDAG
jgi:crotonobetainyl-CoA:carnitine CoA-transferase CaiB-like acyl-CoA transferase